MTKKYNRTYVAFQITKPNDEPEQTKSKLSERRIDHVQTHTCTRTHIDTGHISTERRISYDNHIVCDANVFSRFEHKHVSHLVLSTQNHSVLIAFSVQYTIYSKCVCFLYILNFSLFMCREMNVVEYTVDPRYIHVRTFVPYRVPSLRKMYIQLNCINEYGFVVCMCTTEPPQSIMCMRHLGNVLYSRLIFCTTTKSKLISFCKQSRNCTEKEKEKEKTERARVRKRVRMCSVVHSHIYSSIFYSIELLKCLRSREHLHIGPRCLKLQYICRILLMPKPILSSG